MSKGFTDVSGQTRRHTICVDLDGTLVVNKWPELGDWMPGAVQAMQDFHNAGCKVILYSARLNPYDPWVFARRDPIIVYQAKQEVRAKLDSAGLHFVQIYDLEGKPGASVYIDDRAERYLGRNNSWKKMTEKVLMRLDLDEPEVPEFDYEVAKEADEQSRASNNHA